MKLNFFKRSTLPNKQINPALEEDKRRQRKLRGELTKKQTADYYYLIDIVGACNLRCPSCPVGNYAKSPIGGGQIKLEYYGKVLDKIINEHTDEKLFIDLYNWGEPGLHKHLTEIISMTKEKGIGVGISSNLNFFPDIKNVIKANPDYIRISLSGYHNKVYQQTHRRGDINIVKSNMHLIRHWLDKLNSSTIIEVGFHIYKTNFPNDFLKMQTLCHELDFIFAPVIASLMPAEKALRSIEHNLTPQDQQLVDKLVVTLEERKNLFEPYKNKYKDCEYRQHRTTINYDGTVSLCCATYEKEQFVADNFLEVDRKEIKKRKYQHSFCKQCMSGCLHMTYTNAEQDLVNELAVERLGPIYAEFLDEWRKPLEYCAEWQGHEYSSQDLFDLAKKLESTDPNQAIDCYQALIKEFPRHGDALLNLGKLMEAKNDYEYALDCYTKALRIVPNDERYKKAYLNCKSNKPELIKM